MKVPRRPFLVLGALVLGAIAANLATRNILWAWYSLGGIVMVGLVAWLDHQLQWNLPNRLLWWAGVPLSMHYLGGSLSGLHTIGGPNGLYWVFPWWDNVVHFLGAGTAAVLAAHLLAPRWNGGRGGLVVVVACVAWSLAALVEVYEFLNFAFFATIDQGYYTNTMLDLYYNALGGTTFAWAYTRR